MDETPRARALVLQARDRRLALIEALAPVRLLRGNACRLFRQRCWCAGTQIFAPRQGAAQSLFRIGTVVRQAEVAWRRVRQLLAHALPAFHLVLGLGSSAPRPYPTLERSVSAGGRFRTHDRLMWHSRGGVRYTDPMNSVCSEVWAALDLGGALGLPHWTSAETRGDLLEVVLGVNFMLQTQVRHHPLLPRFARAAGVLEEAVELVLDPPAGGMRGCHDAVRKLPD
ncbi:unnamed protein product, partial [Effrenium voratum]